MEHQWEGKTLSTTNCLAQFLVAQVRYTNRTTTLSSEVKVFGYAIIITSSGISYKTKHTYTFDVFSVVGRYNCQHYRLYRGSYVLEDTAELWLFTLKHFTCVILSNFNTVAHKEYCVAWSFESQSILQPEFCLNLMFYKKSSKYLSIHNDFTPNCYSMSWCSYYLIWIPWYGVREKENCMPRTKHCHERQRMPLISRMFDRLCCDAATEEYK